MESRPEGYRFDEAAWEAQKFGAWLWSGAKRTELRTLLRERGLPWEHTMSDDEVVKQLRDLEEHL